MSTRRAGGTSRRKRVDTSDCVLKAILSVQGTAAVTIASERPREKY